MEGNGRYSFFDPYPPPVVGERKVGIFSTDRGGLVGLKNASVAWSVRVRPAISALFSLPRLPRLDSRPRELLRQAPPRRRLPRDPRASNFAVVRNRYVYRFCLQLRSRVSDRRSSNIFILCGRETREREGRARMRSRAARGLGRTDGWLARLSTRESSREKEYRIACPRELEVNCSESRVAFEFSPKGL